MEQIIFNQFSIAELKEAFKEVLREEIQKIPTSIQRDEKSIYASRKEVASALHISLPTLYELTKTEVLKGYKIQGRVLYKWPEVDQALKRIESLKYKRGQ
jgi:hypothetical protein